MNPHRERPYLIPTLIAGSFVLVLLWAYATTIGEVSWRWGHDPQYSHGYLVPVFAITLLWLRRNHLNTNELKPSALGIAILCIATGIRLFGAFYTFPWLDHISLIGCIAGIAVLVGGRPAWNWAWPAIAFLVFMVPLPHRIEVALSGPMQIFATEASTFVLQVLGRPALSEGNIILLDDLELSIVEACSGLRMLVVFFALSTAVALLISKPIWERTLIALSALPIALIANVIRITLTGVLFETAGPEFGKAVFHDVMGWLMMPIGLAFLALELWILKRLMQEPAKGLRLGVVDGSLRDVAVNPLAVYRSERKTRRPAQTAPKPAASAAPQVVQS